MNKSKLFECGLGFHEYTIPDKKYPHIKICKHCKRFGHFKNNINGYEWWSEYDEKGNEIYCKSSAGYESWKEYDNKGNLIDIKLASVE